jgi:hypothetical protein
MLHYEHQNWCITHLWLANASSQYAQHTTDSHTRIETGAAPGATPVVNSGFAGCRHPQQHGDVRRLAANLPDGASKSATFAYMSWTRDTRMCTCRRWQSCVFELANHCQFRCPAGTTNAPALSTESRKTVLTGVGRQRVLECRCLRWTRYSPLAYHATYIIGELLRGRYVEEHVRDLGTLATVV